MHFSQGDDKTEKLALSPSSQPTIPKEEYHGQEHKEERVCAKHRRLQKIRVQPGRPHSRLQIKDDMSFSLFSLHPSRAFANTAGGGSREERSVEKKKKKKKGTHLPLADDFALPLHHRDALPPKRRSPPRQRVRVDLLGQSTCLNVHGVNPARTGKMSFFWGRQCGGREGRVLGHGAIERGNVVVGRDGCVGLGFRHGHFCGILNFKSD